MKESLIRDKLINKLELLETGLIFIDKEKYLPNSLGTNGFIDILAKDSNNKFVIIELKKSNSSAREALHEILKYLEGIKEIKSLRNDEIRIMIISTVWEELIIPYSSFCKETKLDTSGFLLITDNHGEPERATKIEPLELDNERLLANEAMLDYYNTIEDLNEGIVSQENCFREKNITDYILVILYGPKITGKNVNPVHEPPPDFDYAIYSTTQRLSEEACLKLLDKDPSLKASVMSQIDEWETDEEKIRFLHANILDIEPFPESNLRRIGTAAKFAQMTWYYGWEVNKILKYGRLSKNELLSDLTIISEIVGSNGTDKEKYNREFVSSENHIFTQIKEEISKCLANNIPWQRQILHILDDLEHKSKKNKLKIIVSIYNPMNLLYTIYLVIKYKTPLYIPIYTIRVEGESDSEVYLGSFKENGNRPSLQNIIDKYFNGNPSELFISLTWGGYLNQNIRIAEDMGLDYTTFKISKIKQNLKYEIYSNSGYREHGPVDVFELDSKAVRN